jgi:Ca2+-binding RTX toxin-like protein
MRRAVLLLVVAAAVLALAGGMVWAEDKICTGTGGDCVGTREADNVSGSNSSDRVALLEGNDSITQPPVFNDNDTMYGDEGNDFIHDGTTQNDNDTIYGDEGNDTINVEDAAGPDTVNCGPGKRDKVFFNEDEDTISRNCEIKNPQ